MPIRQIGLIVLPAFSPFAKGMSEKLAPPGLDHEVVERLRAEQVFTGGADGGDSAPLLDQDGLGQPLEGADLNVELVLVYKGADWLVNNFANLK